MSADLASDPAILATYNEIRNPDSVLDWLFLGYCPTGSKDKLELAGKGNSGLEGLKAALSQSNALNIHFGLLRLEGRFLLFTLLPDNTGGVKRARALVHSRAVGTKLQHQATLTVARPSDLTINAVRSKLKLDTGSASSSLPPSPNPQLSGGASMSSQYLQPSPLRSHFPSSQVQAADNDESPPPPPDKDVQAIYKIRSNNSLRTPQLSTPPFSPPMRQSSRETNDPSSPQSMHQSPNLNGTPNARTRQLSTASASSANAHPAVGLGLGSSVSSTNSQRDMPNSHTHSSPIYNHTPVSPRLASLEFERDHRRTASQNGYSSPTLANIPEGSNINRLTPRSASPAGSSSSKFSASNGQQPQDQPLPLSASPSVPDSARSLEASTLDSMFRPSESLESFNDEKIAKRSLGRSSPTNAERIAVAEAIARATEEKWKAEQKRASLDQVRTGNSAEAVHLNGVNGLGHSTTEGSVVKEMQEDEAGRAAKQAAEEQQEELRREAEEERARLEEEARQRAEATRQAEQKRIEAEAEAERVKQEEEAEAERKRIEADVEVERLRKEEEAEAERKRQEEEAEAERKRLEEEAEAERKRQEEEAEAERKKQEEEAEAERQRQEAAAAAEAERKRIEEEKEAAERARLEAIEAAAREKEAAKRRAKDGVRERLQSSSGDVALTGFVSVQGGSSILWRRRYFQLSNTSLKLFKNDKDVSSPVDEVDLANNAKRIDEAAEDLLAIPHSFKLVFNDYDEDPYLFYCDEEDDKDLLVFAIKVAAKLE